MKCPIRAGIELEAPSDPPTSFTPLSSAPEFPPTPPSSKEKEKPPRWIRYQDEHKYRGQMFQPPRRSERLRAVIQSIPGWEKY